MQKTGIVIPRKAFGTGAVMAGAAGIIAGFVLFYFLDPAIFYDLGLYVAVGGMVLLAYGIYQIFVGAGHEDGIEISRKTGRNFLVSHSLMLVLLAGIAVIMMIQPRFLQLQVLLDILAQSSTRIIVALGVGLTILAAGMDLSAGRMLGLSAVISASMLQTADCASRFYPDLPQMALVVPLIMSILVCAVFGAVNGFLIIRCSVHPLLATLAVQVIVYGTATLYFDMDQSKSQIIGGLRPDLVFLGQHKLLQTGGFPGISILILIAALIVSAVWFLLNKTAFGKTIYEMGGHRDWALVSGKKGSRTVWCVFILAAVLYGVAGILEAARTGGATNNYGSGYELDAVAACAVGGISLKGGSGKISGIVNGVLVFTVIQYGLQFLAVNPMWQLMIKGIIIAVAAAVDFPKYRIR